MLERSNMLQALQRVERNGGAPGADGMAVEELRPFLRTHWDRIRAELLQGQYRPQPVRRVEIPKPSGGVRELGIPTVLDRLIQQALLQVLPPIFDPHFSAYSYGYRPAAVRMTRCGKRGGMCEKGRPGSSMWTWTAFSTG
jgi:retron-type reverse transcriptase